MDRARVRIRVRVRPGQHLPHGGEQGARLVQLAPETQEVAPIIAAHHERPDGAGYPAGLGAEQIPLGARIVAVCDAWSAMLADRPYRRALTEAEAVEQLQRGRGTQFDSAVVDAFIRLMHAGELEPQPTSEPAPGTVAG